MDLPKSSQITVAPRCIECGSTNNVARSSQRIASGLMHDGDLCYANKQYRQCRDCSATFPVIKIGSPIPKNPPTRYRRSN